MEMYAASYRGISVTAAGGTLHGSKLRRQWPCTSPFRQFPWAIDFFLNAQADKSHESCRTSTFFPILTTFGAAAMTPNFWLFEVLGLRRPVLPPPCGPQVARVDFFVALGFP